MQLEIKERLAQRLAHLALAFAGALPAGEAHQPHDLVDLGDEALHDDRCVRRAHFLEEFGERRLAAVFILGGRRLLLGHQQVAGQVEQLLEKLDAVQLPLLVPLLE